MAWTESSKRTMVYDNARMAMDLISRDVQCLIYTENNSVVDNSIYPFWHEARDKINFITITNIKSSGANSSTCEVKYARSDGIAATGLCENGLNKDNINYSSADLVLIPAGWLVRSVTGDNEADRYNYKDLDRNHADPKRAYTIWKEYELTPGAWIQSSDDFAQIIPYVVDLEFVCYGVDNAKNFIKLSEEMPSIYDLPNGGEELGIDHTANGTPLPTCLQVNLIIMDKVSWNKWEQLVRVNSDVAGGSPDARWETVMGDITADNTISKEFREKMQRKFTKMIFLGNKDI